LLLWVDGYYFLWAYNLTYTLPKATSDALIKALRGNIIQAKDYLLKEFTKEIEKLKKESDDPVIAESQ